MPLVVPEVNAETLAGHHGIVANPNCVAIPLSIVLAPLLHALRPAPRDRGDIPGRDGAGQGPRRRSSKRRRATTPPARRPPRIVYPHVLHGNVVPGGWTMEGDDTEEELKVIAETRRVLGAPDAAA